MNARKRVFRLPLSRSRIDADLHEEFRFHIEERIEQFVAEGMSREEAEREVERRFGDYETHRTLTRQIDEDTMHRRHRSERLRDIRREVTLAARTLRRTPGFTLIASLTLAIGLGATVAIFSVLDAVVLRPLAYRNADALVSVLHPAVVPGSGERRWGLSPGGYFFLRANNASLADLAMYRNTGFPVTNGGEAEMTQVAQVTASIFPVLQARPAAGRLLTEADDKPGAPKVVVLSHEFLQRRFGGDLAMVGRNLETSAGTFEIVGVAEPGLVLPMPGPFASTANLSGFGVDVWIPMQLNPAGPFYNNHPYVGIGRLKPGVAPAAAQRDLERLFARFPEVLPDVYSAKFVENYNFRIEASPLRDAVLGPKVPRVLWMLFAAVSLVLVIAAANVSNLFLVRMEARRREAAIRVALGADRVHMSTHYLAETLLLCIGAAIVGVGIAAAGLQLLMAVAPTDIPRLATSAIDGRAVTVALTVALALSLLLGLAPLLRRTTDLGVLREAGRGLSPSRGQRAVRNSLVIGQIALALMLLSAAGVMLRSFDRLRDVQPGFDATGVLTFEVSLPYTEFT
ncbi:MAG: ABC transporter permease, partial [Gemmatimonadota bacterium]